METIGSGIVKCITNVCTSVCSGEVSNGTGKLVGIDLDASEWEAFAAGIASLARERERKPNDFDVFLEVCPWLP